MTALQREASAFFAYSGCEKVSMSSGDVGNGVEEECGCVAWRLSTAPMRCR